MQICYRCSKETNRFLAMDAHEKGISKNRLIDGIVQDYLRGDHGDITALSATQTERELLSHIRSADERLAQILDGIDHILSCTALQDNVPYDRSGDRSDSRVDRQADGQMWAPDPPALFRRQLIGALLDIAKDLEGLHKGWEAYRKRMDAQDPLPM